MFSYKLLSTLAALFAAASSVGAAPRGNTNNNDNNLKTLRKKQRRNLGMNKRQDQLVLEVTNLSYQQPFSGFFVMVHDEEAEPLFECGEEASEALAILAEDGNPGPLVEYYTNVSSTGVGYVGIHADGAPYFGGDTTYIMVPDDHDYPYVTIASMTINTNDCFVALNGVMMMPGLKVESPGYDAGSEENNELCESIPGPACAADSGNVRSGNGEGFVHVHRGFFGIGGELSASGYDWRNPMMKVKMYEFDEDMMSEDGSMKGDDSGEDMVSGDENMVSGDENMMPEESSPDAMPEESSPDTR